MIFALAGNQNCGKTTLFNQLTGSNQHVGNFPGVTVERKSGTLKGFPQATVVDLPGIYSLSPYTPEEIVTRDYLLGGEPDAIINIVDATNIERNLYLTLQLLELKLPTVLALNMMDEVRSSGSSIDINALQQELGIPVIPIAASRNEGVAELVQRAIRTCEAHQLPKRLDFCSGEVHKAIHSTAHIVEEKAKAHAIPVRFAASKLVERDGDMSTKLGLSLSEEQIIDSIITEMEETLGTDCEAALADSRYNYIEGLCRQTVVKRGETKEQQRSVKLDNILTHKFFAIPIFLIIMLLVFWLTFGVFGATLSDLFQLGIDRFTALVDQALSQVGINPVIHSLIIDGVFAGVGSVLSFLPTIVILFFFLSMLEDSGYMARVAFVMDKLLRKIGLSGRSFVPMLIGFGCSVPAIMATRTLVSERDRKMTILLTPFMSCSAKLPIYAVFTAAFFPQNGALVMICLYVLGMATGIVSALLFKHTLFRGEPVPFVLELPAYRLPALKNILLHMWEKAKDFLVKAFTIIFLATIVIWFLQRFDFRLNMVADSSQSILAAIGRLIAPIFVPLGFGDWRISTALLTGLTAKEAVISTLAVLLGRDIGTLAPALQGLFSPLTAASFLAFTLLYVPCVAAMAALRREMGSTRAMLGTMVYQTAVAWIVAFIVYQIGALIVL